MTFAEIAEKARQKGTVGTAQAVVKRVWRGVMRVRRAIEDLLFVVGSIPVRLLPTRSQARLKHWLAPVTTLDYAGAVILVHADSDIDIGRAGACAKEPETVQWIEESVLPGDVLYDIGANVGAYSLVAAKHTSGRALVYAFEPSFATFYQLCRNILLNRCQDAIRPFMIALAERSGPVVFNYRSVDAGSALHSVGDARAKMGKPFTPQFSQQIVGFTIDHLVSEFGFRVPNHIKLDVDGTEVEVLQGAEQTLRDPAVRSILVELYERNDEIERATRFLVERGFVLTLRQNHFGGPYWNHIFKRTG